jgi:hypothetical protein
MRDTPIAKNIVDLGGAITKGNPNFKKHRSTQERGNYQTGGYKNNNQGGREGFRGREDFNKAERDNKYNRAKTMGED